MRRTTTLFAAGLLLFTATASAQDSQFGDSVLDDTPSAAAMAFDLVLVRPVALVATVITTGIFVLQLPIAALQGEIRPAAQALVVEPARYTFIRPLGRSD